MTAPRNQDTLIRAFLDEGLVELPDRTFDAVRRDIHRTRQRAVIGPWKEPNVTTLSRLAIAAAVVVAVGVAWVNLGPVANFGPPGPSPTPTAISTPAPVSGFGTLPPGRYAFDWSRVPGSDGEPGPTISITIPSQGWTAYDTFAADKNYGPGDAGAGPSFVVWKITNRYVDPCTPDVVLSPAPGNGVDELLESLANQPGITAESLSPVTVDGYSGASVELTVATDIATCAEGFFPWIDKFVQGNNERLRVYALDVDGLRLTFFLRIPERTLPADLAELEGIVDSIDIEP
jgi:hypothetical protein